MMYVRNHLIGKPLTFLGRLKHLHKKFLHPTHEECMNRGGGGNMLEPSNAFS